MKTYAMNEPVQLASPEPLSREGVALFLDLDGTLAPFAARPQDVGPDAARTRLISNLGRRLQGRLAVISGRTLSDIDRILEHATPAAAGVHGLERRDAQGRVLRPAAEPAISLAREALAALAAAWPGVLIEDKTLSVALHFRGVPDAAEAVARVAATLAAEANLTLQLGDMVAELRPAGPDKGAALRAFMAEAPFEGATPIFVGDDATDESAFAAARDLGGYGVLVGPQRPTAASRRLNDVAAVMCWLGALETGSAAA